MLGLDDPAAGLTDHQVAFANARHTQAVRALKTGQPRHAERLLREAVAVASDHASGARTATCPPVWWRRRRASAAQAERELERPCRSGATGWPASAVGSALATGRRRPERGE